MVTMVEEPLLPSYSDPVTEKRWAVTRFGATLEHVRVILIIGEQQNLFFYTVQGSKGPELRSTRKVNVAARFDTEEDAKIAISRAKLAWTDHAEAVKTARQKMRDAEAARVAAWIKALKEPSTVDA